MTNLPAPTTRVRPTDDGERHPGFLLVFFTAFLLSWCGFTAFNVIVDPRGEFGTGLLPPLVGAAGGSFGEKLQWLAQNESEVETALFGTSTAMNILSGDLKEAGLGNAVNFASENMHLTDVGVAVDKVLDAHPEIRHVIVAIDLHELVQHYPARLFTSPSGPGFSAWVNAATSKDYLFASAHSVKLAVVGYPETTSRFAANGDLVEEARWGARSRAEVGDDVFFAHESAFEGKAIHPESFAFLEDFVGPLLTGGRNVTLFLQPVHLELFNRLGDSQPSLMENLVDARSRLKALCATGLRAFVAQPEVGAALRLDDFSDGIHYGRANGKAIADLLGRATDDCQA